MSKTLEKIRTAFGGRKKPQLDLEDYLQKIKKAGLDESGHELVSSKPMQPPLGYKKQPSLAELVREMVQSEALRQKIESEGGETLEEFEDFDVEDEPEMMSSPWENQHDPSLAELQAAGEAELRSRQVRGGEGGTPPPSPGPSEAPGREAPARQAPAGPEPGTPPRDAL